MNRVVDRSRSLEELTGDFWPEPPEYSPLGISVHALRRRPVGTLEADELRRLVSQRVALVRTVPLAVEALRREVHRAHGGILLESVLLEVLAGTGRGTWAELPEVARDFGELLAEVTERGFELSRTERESADAFLTWLTAGLPEALVKRKPGNPKGKTAKIRKAARQGTEQQAQRRTNGQARRRGR
ncbi:contact-dependent growth inhibition system immunity protein [Streptomyces sp. NBC_01142]|uniref:contact-dependent growth inhibition system immunity protein n=1 Tax=Streptomyces sp. NBC_01142 TaxID=2975865 RepID=UPI002259A18F|nr:contact-dependent growth inhibition system immunity protein [Streptomyces sp. NBC_01142]MCX4821186.1 contact-dependent growth inhibition system immunity protein [Streptomyces sp. NBC_01142]